MPSSINFTLGRAGLVLVVLLISCIAPDRPTATAEKPLAKNAEATTANAPQGHPTSSLANDPRRKPYTAPPPPIEEPAAAEERGVDLGMDTAWVNRAMPPKDIARYRRWRQRGRIRVGQTHLSTALPTFDEQHIIVMSGMEASVRVYERQSKKLVGNYSVAGFDSGSFARGTVIPWLSKAGDPQFLVGNERGIDLYSGLTGTHLGHLSDVPTWEMRFSPDRRTLVTSRSSIPTQSSVMTFFAVGADGRSLDRIGELDFEQRVDGFDLSDDNRYLAVTFYPGDTLDLIRVSTGETVWSVPAPTYSASVDISPDGSLVAVGGNHLLLVSARAPSTRGTFDQYNNNINTVRFSPSGDAVGTSAYDGHLRIIGASLGGKKSHLKLLKDLRHGGTANVYSVSWIDGGRGIVSSSGDKTVRIWGK